MSTMTTSLPAELEEFEIEAGVCPTAEQLAQVRDQLAAEFPHLSVSVEIRDGALFVEAVPTCPDWCAHTITCDPASVDGAGEMWHQGAVTVISTAEHSSVSARLELFDHPVFCDEYPHRYSVEISGDLDVPIEHARALGEYLIAMADQYGPPRS